MKNKQINKYIYEIYIEYFNQRGKEKKMKK